MNSVYYFEVRTNFQVERHKWRVAKVVPTTRFTSPTLVLVYNNCVCS